MAVYILIACLGFIAGWAINYAADVLPITRRFSRPTCVQCSHPTAWQDYILFKSCPECGRRVLLRRFVVLFLCTLGTVYFWINPSTRLGFAAGWVTAAYFLLVFIIDVEYRLVLHPTSIAGAAVGLGVGTWLHGFWTTLLGGLAGFGIMLALYYLGELFARWMARRRGQELDEVALGFGDVNLSGILGLFLGWPGIIAGLVLAILLGGLFSILYLGYHLIKRSYQPFTAVPYAPFLILGAAYLLYRL